MMVDLKLYDLLQVCLHREPPEVGGVKKLSGTLYWWVEQCVPTQHMNKLQETTVFAEGEKLTYAMKMMPEK